MVGPGAGPDPKTLSGLREYDRVMLLAQLKVLFPRQWADFGHSRRDYYRNMRRALLKWVDGAIESDGRDSWRSFSTHILAVLGEACDGRGERIVLVTSKDPIAVMLGHPLGLTPEKNCELSLQIKNSSISTAPLQSGRSHGG